MNRILTIDCWGTLIKGSPDKERIIYIVAKRLRVDFTALKVAIINVDRELSPTLHKITQYEYWLAVSKTIKDTDGTTIDPLVAMLKYNEVFEEYEPACINVDAWRNVISKAIAQGYKIRILSNVGYLRSHQLEELINRTFRFRDYIRVVGSDLVNEAKPSKEFYTKALPMFNKDEDIWIHIGDNEELDIKPVQELGGTAVKFVGWDTFDKVDITSILLAEDE